MSRAEQEMRHNVAVRRALEFTAAERDCAVLHTRHLLEEGLDDAEVQYICVYCWDKGLEYERRSYAFYKIFVVLRFLTVLLSPVATLMAGFQLISENTYLRMVTFACSFVVAVATGTLSFTRYGKRSKLYRLTAEKLRLLGWDYLLLQGQFAAFESHKHALGDFVKELRHISEETAVSSLEILESAPGEDGQMADIPKSPGRGRVKRSKVRGSSPEA